MRENPANFTPRLRSDNAVERPHVDAYSRSRGTVYAGGTFRTVSNAADTRTYRRHHVMAFDAATGVVRSFAPKVDGPIWSVQAVGKAVYLGGSFRHVNGVRRIGLVKVDARTGKVRRRFNADFPSGRVNEIRRVDGRLLVGGSFPQALVALRPRTGRDTGYLRLRVRGEISGSWGRTAVYRFAVSPDNNRLVAVGNFTTVSGKSRKRAFMVGLRDNRGRLARWYCRAFRKPCSSTDARRVAFLQDVDFSRAAVTSWWCPPGRSPAAETLARRCATPRHASRPTFGAPTVPRGSTTPAVTAPGRWRPPGLPCTCRDTSPGWTTPVATRITRWTRRFDGEASARSTR
ncbi:MAG: hypothetical protein M3467_11230 [Actinomycetota bacterium]|nr:hypothetical protein [Actinomycetota bacterium]